jgi:ribonuclease HI
MKSLYCVGYTYANPGKAGWGVVVVEDGKVTQELSGGYRLSTDPRMHVLAFLRGLEQIAEGDHARCVTCSEYVYDTVVLDRLGAWAGRWNWQGIDGKERPNRDLWEKVKELLESRSVEMVFQEKKAGDAELWKADQLARRAASRSSDIDYGFEESERGIAYRKAEKELRQMMERLFLRDKRQTG